MQVHGQQHAITAGPEVAGILAAHLRSFGRQQAHRPQLASPHQPPARVEQREIRGEYPGDLKPGRYRVLMTMELQGKAMTRTAEMVIR